MWRPPHPSHLSDWVSSALAALALLIFIGGGASWYHEMQQQKVQDEVRTSRLLGCLDDAQLTVDPTAAINVCRKKYADRVPALLESNPYAFVPHREPASATPTLDAMSTAGSTTSRPTLSGSPAPEAANLPDPGPSVDASEEPAEHGNSAAAQAAHPPVGNGKSENPPSVKNQPATHPPHGNQGQSTKGGKPSPKPKANDHASRPAAPPRNGHVNR